MFVVSVDICKGPLMSQSMIKRQAKASKWSFFHPSPITHHPSYVEPTTASRQPSALIWEQRHVISSSYKATRVNVDKEESEHEPKVVYHRHPAPPHQQRREKAIYDIFSLKIAIAPV
jgi:hypothetical protein